jgi:hypothetical protein
LAFQLDRVVLAELDVPDVAAADAQLNELLQPGGERVEPAAEDEARDPSGTVGVVVDEGCAVLSVGIRRGWPSRIPAPRLAGVLFQTYVTAVQRATVVGHANAAEPAAARPVEEIPALDENLPYDEWIAAVRARMDDVDAQLDRIHRADAGRAAPVTTDVRSPRGYFALQLRDGSPAGLTGAVEALANAGSERLQSDVLEVFAAAGLAVPTAQSPSRSDRQPPPEDEDAFEFRYDE